MYEEFGAKVEGNKVTFRLFFPDRAKDPSQYTTGGLPNIKKIQIPGSFQTTNWDLNTAPEMRIEDHPKGILYTFSINNLQPGFYEYKYYVTFNDNSTRWCNDPCTKYSGKDPNNENSAFVVGGHQVDKVKPIANRLPQKDLIIYEVMINDFTEKLIDINSNDPPKSRLDLVRDKIQHLKDLGINTVQFMPWTAVLGREFNWGYEPFLFFSVEDRYTSIVNKNNPANSQQLDKLYRLKELIEALHEADMHVIMDGVFNHADAEDNQKGVGFPYYWLYHNPKDSPYIGQFAGQFGFKDLNYANDCTEEFIFDVCKYWFDVYQIDGIRFDFSLGYFEPNCKQGMPRLILSLLSKFNTEGRKNISLTIEHLTEPRYDAIDVVNKVDASGCWYDPFMYEVWKWAKDPFVDTVIMRSMNANRDFAPDKAPVVYIGNHDHGTVVNEVSGRQIGPDVRPNNWFKTQPCAIGLFTLPGSILIYNGQEFGDEYFVPTTGTSGDRVSSRPLNWERLEDFIGQRLFGLYKQLIEIRKNYPSLRSANFQPINYDRNNIRFDENGYGLDLAQKIIIYRRWGNNSQNKIENFVIVLNFSPSDRFTDIPFPVNGQWKDLLNDNQIYQVTENRLTNQNINSHWGRILYHVA